MTLIEPEVSDPELEDDEPKLAHIIRAEKVFDGYIGQEVVEALCGKRWVPKENPHDGRPLCPKCAEVLKGIRAGRGGAN